MASPDVKNYSRNGIRIIRPSENLTLTFQSNVHFQFRLVTDIMRLKRDAEFVRELIDKKELCIGKLKFKLGESNVEARFIDQLNMIIELGNALEEIGCNILVPFGDFSEEDIKQLDLLRGIHAGKVTFNTNENIFRYTWEFRGKAWPIVVDLSDDSTRLCSLVFNTGYATWIGDSKDMNIVPNYLYLDKELLANLYYYDYESMYEQIDRSTVNNETAEALNILSLNLIGAYDISGNEKLLDVASALLDRLEESFPGLAHYTVNQGQIEVRKKGKVSDRISKRLEELTNDTDCLITEDGANIEKEFLYCIAVLNNNGIRANELYLQMTDAEKQAIDNWPIRTLHLKTMSEIDRKNDERS